MKTPGVLSALKRSLNRNDLETPAAKPAVASGSSMIPWVHLDTATVPGGDTLKLMQRGSEFSIMAGATTLMNSRMSGSEIALAELACDRLRGRRNCRILIGGYGMGFTLRAALAGLGADAQILVAELVPAVIE